MRTFPGGFGRSVGAGAVNRDGCGFNNSCGHGYGCGDGFGYTSGAGGGSGDVYGSALGGGRASGLGVYPYHLVQYWKELL